MDALTAKSRSRVAVRDMTVFLFAEDEQTDVLDSSSCVGDEGAQEHRGTYRLVSTRNGGVLDSLNLGPRQFADGRDHDGLHLINLPRGGERLLTIYGYGSCSGEDIEIFRVDPGGRIARVPFTERDGKVHEGRSTTNPATLFDRDGRLVLCIGDSWFLRTCLFCDAFRYTGERLVAADTWMFSDPRTPQNEWSRPTAQSRAGYALYRYLTSLGSGHYADAADLYGGTIRALRDAVPGAAEDESARVLLEGYCSAPRQCYGPLDIRTMPSVVDAQYGFEVSFAAGSGDSVEMLRVAGRTEWPFRVARRDETFRVLDLPPNQSPDE